MLDWILLIVFAFAMLTWLVVIFYYRRENRRLEASNRQLRDIIAMVKAYPERVRDLGRPVVFRHEDGEEYWGPHTIKADRGES